MLRGIIGTSIEYRFLVIAVIAAVVLFGAGQLAKMPLDVLPEFSPPYVEIQTEALGLSAEEVENLITVPMEQDLLNGVAWLDVIRSESVPGLSSITLIFEPGTDLYRARQMVAERLAQAPLGLPHVSKPPTMLQPTSATSRVMIVGLSSKTLPLIQMSVLARWTIGPRLTAVPGVANVAIWGLRDRQLQVQTDPERLRAHGVSLLQVLETTGNALWVSSLSYVEASTPGNAGFIDTPQQRIGVRHVLPIISPEGLGQVPIEGAQVRLMDVADVVEDHQPLIGDALTNNGTGLLIVIQKYPGSNTLEVTRGVEEALAALRPGLSGIEIDSTVFRPATFIETAMNNLARTLLIGGALLALVLFAFFFNWRTALISIIAIPLSLLAAGLVLYLRHATLNIIVLAGLLMALGVVVDEAIVDVENILRRLRQPRKEGQSAASIILEASFEVRGAIFFAALICLLAALPVFSLQGVTGAFFQPLAISYVLAVLASMLVALTVTPMLCAVLLSNTPADGRVSPLAGWLQRGYDRALARIISRPRGVYPVVAVIAAAGLAMLPFIGPSLLPTFKEPDLLIRLDAAPGTSHPAMVRLVDQVARELRSIPGIRNVGAQVGRAVFGDQVVGINSAELWISVAPAADYAETVAAIHQTVDNYPGLQRDVQTYLDQTSGKVTAAPDDSIVVRIYGQDWAMLRDKAEEVKQTLAGIAGVVGATVKLPVEQPTLDIEVDLAAAQHYGIKPGDVRRAAATLLNGLQVGSLFDEQKVFDVVVWSVPETRQSVSSVRDLLLDTPDGGRVRLGDVAQARVEPSPTVVKHDDVSRYIDVGLNVSGRGFGAVMGDVERGLRQVQFPLEYHAEVLGEYAQQQAAQNRFLGLAGVALIGMFLLLQAGYQSWRLALLTFLTMPLALVGGLLAARAGGGALSASLGLPLGLIAVFGIAARNQTMLIHRYQQLEQDEGQASGPELVLRGARERLAPILMTALAIGLALAPFVFFGNIPGHEIGYPMAVVILGGLVTSTLLNLFVVPALYSMTRGKPREAAGVEATASPRTSAPAESEVLVATDLRKSYGPRPALRGLSFSLKAGRILGFLGPNGAGKTTAIRILTTILEPDAGRFVVDGVASDQPESIRRRIGVLPESLGFPKQMTAVEHLTYFGQLYGQTASAARAKGLALLKDMGLELRANSLIGSYSRGMRQRLGIARALIHDPAVVFLDEPTLGLDPRGQQELLTLVQRIARERNTAIVLCSHLLAEVESVCDDVVIMNSGRIVAQGTVAEVIGGTQRNVLRVRVPAPSVSQALQVLGALPNIAQVVLTGEWLRVELADGAGVTEAEFPRLKTRILDALLRAEIPVSSFEANGGRLQEVFLQLTEETIK